MMTFSEACERVMLRKIEHVDEDCPDMNEAAQKYQEMHTEIQNSVEATIIADQLLAMGAEHGWPLHVVIRIALSHGTMIGMEMEKQEI